MKTIVKMFQIKKLIPGLLIITQILSLCGQDETMSEKGDFFTGPFMKIFQPGDHIFVYPTGFEEDTIRKDFYDWGVWYMSTFNPGTDPLSDTVALDQDLSGYNIFTVGNLQNNLWLRANAGNLRFSMTDRSITTDTVYFGDDMVLALCQPNPLSPEKGLFIFGLQKSDGMDHFDKAGQSWLNSEWSITDSSGTLVRDDFEKENGKWFYREREFTEMRGEAKWIWYPGDFAIELNRRSASLRRERNEIYPTPWRLDAPFGKVRFLKKVRLAQPDTIAVYADGEWTITHDGPSNRLYDFDPEKIPISPGYRSIQIDVVNFDGLPSLFVKGRSIVSDTSWRTSVGWPNEMRVPGSWYFNDPSNPPGNFRLHEKEIRPVSVVQTDTSVFADFGQETFGRLILEGVQGEGDILVIYGESEEEASAGKRAETWEIREINYTIQGSDTLPVPMGFRYVNLIPSGDVAIQDVSHLYEYLPVRTRATFECSDPVLEQIYKASARTLELNTREVMTDGIKRDRWAWAGDIFIGLHCNYYHFFDEDVIRRSQVALRGHDPVLNHINMIPGFSFYWFINMYNHYFYTGDTLFISENYDKMKSMLEFCLDRRNDHGFYSIGDNDWPWVDWTMFPFREVMSFDQILLLRSIQIMAEFAELLNSKDDAEKYQAMASELKEIVWKHFWNKDIPGFIHHTVDSGDAPVTRYSNIYAIELGYMNKEEISGISDSILLDDSYPETTVPFHRAFEVSALCRAGMHEVALKRMRDHWKLMLDMGATTFWEYYAPGVEGARQYRHDREFSKSLCHAWSAGPLYITGRHIAGIQSLSPGYKSYLVEPNLCGLEWFRADIPVKGGMVSISMDERTIKVKSSIAGGKCRFQSTKKPKLSHVLPEQIDTHLYEVSLDKDREYEIRYY